MPTPYATSRAAIAAASRILLLFDMVLTAWIASEDRCLFLGLEALQLDAACAFGIRISVFLYVWLLLGKVDLVGLVVELLLTLQLNDFFL